jgi:hypothetical protein
MLIPLPRKRGESSWAAAISLPHTIFHSTDADAIMASLYMISPWPTALAEQLLEDPYAALSHPGATRQCCLAGQVFHYHATDLDDSIDLLLAGKDIEPTCCCSYLATSVEKTIATRSLPTSRTNNLDRLRSTQPDHETLSD